jgi:hypothetical protein
MVSNGLLFMGRVQRSEYEITHYSFDIASDCHSWRAAAGSRLSHLGVALFFSSMFSDPWPPISGQRGFFAY